MKYLQPIRHHVLVELELPPERNGSILLPENVRHLLQQSETGRILEVGKDCGDLKQGARVHLTTNQGIGMTLNGRKCVIINHKNILAVIE